MKRIVFVSALMCLVMVKGNAQTYGYDRYAELPTADLYDTEVMNMSLSAYRDMAARRDRLFKYYAELTVNAFHNHQWHDVISYGNHLISIVPVSLGYYMRGAAYEALGYYKEALSDYKKGKKGDCPEAAIAYNALKAKMKEMKKRKK